MDHMLACSTAYAQCGSTKVKREHLNQSVVLVSITLLRLDRNSPPNRLETEVFDLGFSDGVLVPDSPPAWAWVLLASRACLTASCARFRSCELEKNVARPTQIDRPPTGAPCSSSILSAIRARWRASDCVTGSATCRPDG